MDSGTESTSYSPDLSPPDFFFPKIKSTLNARRLKDAENVKIIATKELLALPASDFKKCFQQLHKRGQNCVTSQEEYYNMYWVSNTIFLKFIQSWN
jgi:2-oxoglutarate dehydrogenase complex dehydrogenase (E1) component-like enzyme